MDEKDDLLAGREPRPKGDDAGPTVKLVCDAYLTHNELKRDNGEIQPRTFKQMTATCLMIADAFGRGRLVTDLRPDDFRQLRNQLAQRRGPVALGIEIQRIRSVFLFAYNDGLVETPIRFGKGFDKPSAKTLRIERAKRGRRDLSAEQVRAIIEKAGIPLKAMILLAVNAGFGNNDVGTLPLAAIDLDTGWVSWSRPKTGIARRAKLWPETIAAVQSAIAKRPEPADKDVGKLVFVTKYGQSWAKGAAGNDPVGGEFKKLLKDLEFHRDGIGFYSLRRTFRTVADQVRDTHAIDLVMGHAADVSDMGALYTQNIGDDRLEAVAAHVRGWLFPAKPKAK
jgi:integrase